MCICTLRYPACNAHAPYHLWHSPLYRISPHYLINETIFGKTLLTTKCLFRVSLQLLSEIFFIIRRTEQYIIKNVYWSSCKYPLFLSDFNGTNFLDSFSKYPQISNFMKIRPVGAAIFHTDGQMDGRT